MINPTKMSMASWLTAGLGFHAVAASASSPPRQPTGSLDRRQFPHGEHPFGWNHHWAEMTPSRELEWQECYDFYKCARLIVPMDYAECGSNETVALAVMMLPAQNTTGEYLGPLFHNPGGPGGSGVEMLLMDGDRLQSYFGDNYDIISWDTRGTWRSTPTVNCFATNQRRHMYRASWQFETDEFLFDDPAVLAQATQKHRLEHVLCRSMHGETGILQHISSEHHARDMNSILSATGRDKLRYYGFSYGTSIGIYYATLFPHKVERMLNEANVDVRAQYEGDFFASFGDAQRTRDYVYERCAADSHCPFHQSTAEAVGQRIEALIEQMRFHPGLWHMDTFPTLLTDAVMRRQLDSLFRGATSRGDGFMAQIASDANHSIEEHDEAEIMDWPNSWQVATDDRPAEINNPDYRTGFDDVLIIGVRNEEYLTGCADRGEVDLDPEALMEQYKRARELTPATLWPLMWGTQCAGATKPKKRFDGSFGGTPDFPILFANAWDSTTPMLSAHRNAELFTNSSVVGVNAYGHSIARSSRCVWKHVNAYFNDGVLPGNVTCDDMPELGFGPNFQPVREQPWLEEDEEWEAQAETRRHDFQREDIRL